jgi:hypothetical protein
LNELEMHLSDYKEIRNKLKSPVKGAAAAAAAAITAE